MDGLSRRLRARDVQPLSRRAAAPPCETEPGSAVPAWRLSLPHSRSLCSGETDPVERELVPLLDGFQPNALLISSWHRPQYRRIARSQAGRAVRILAVDNQWYGTPKQWAGRLVAPWYIQPLYDNAVVPGPRQRRFAGMLGFSSAAIIEPLLSCDVAKFLQCGRDRCCGRRAGYFCLSGGCGREERRAP